MSDTNNNVLQLRAVGYDNGCYRTYFQDNVTDKMYVLIDFRGTRTWYTAVCNYGEPDIPLKNDTVIKIIHNGRIVSREKIIRINECNSIGIKEVLADES